MKFSIGLAGNLRREFRQSASIFRQAQKRMPHQRWRMPAHWRRCCNSHFLDLRMDEAEAHVDLTASHLSNVEAAPAFGRPLARFFLAGR
jgi:hypothetical protein